jgi:DMSO/TMAO reductase YedYZ molybdopterin-dependent catalytic subunit
MKRPLVGAFVCGISLLCADTSARAQAPATSSKPRSGTLVVAGDVPKPMTWTVAELKSLPRTKATVTEEGRTIVYEGVLVGELLGRAGAPMGELRGDALSTYVLAVANDGYQVLFSIGELDPELTGREIVVADTVDGKPLFDYQGPLRMVAAKDLRGARSVRMLERLDVVRLKK